MILLVANNYFSLVKKVRKCFLQGVSKFLLGSSKQVTKAAVLSPHQKTSPPPTKKELISFQNGGAIVRFHAISKQLTSLNFDASI